MPEYVHTASDRIDLIDRLVTELILLAKQHCPEAIVEVLFTHYEDEDAHILVLVPKDTSEMAMDRLQAMLTQRCVEILDEIGVLILAGVYEISQQ